MNDLFLENILFTIATVGYVLASLAYFFTLSTKKDALWKWAQRITLLAFLFQTAAILVRALATGRPPLSNQYEFATAFSWGIALFFILFERKYKYYSMGAFILPIAVLVIGYAALQSKEVRPLMPALQSGWLAIHVSLAILSYGSFAVSCGVSVMYLVKDKNPASHLPETGQLDEISYRAVIIGFLCLTLTIISGAIWAQYSWGRYWAWDPKETWSLITWLIYTVYLHMRRTKGMAGRRAALFSVIGFVCVLFTYVGVNTLLPSLHSYV